MFNRFQMSTPAYMGARNRLSDMDWNTSFQNLLNWADKGVIQLNKLIPALKKIAFQDGANVNVDEIWLRNHAYNKKRKTYMWCQVNRKARIVIFFYEDTTDGEYSIDNMAAERAIRPITVQRKNSLFFGSVKGIQNSAIYNTFIETCKQAGGLLQRLLLQAAQRIKKGKNGLRKPSSQDNVQIKIVKFVDSFLDGCLLVPVYKGYPKIGSLLKRWLKP